MDFKLIILLAVFLMANARSQIEKNNNSRRAKSMKTASNSNRVIIRVQDPGSFTTAVPITTYKPRSLVNYFKTSTSSSTPAENYQSSVNYDAQIYQSRNYQPNKLSHYESQNYQSSDVRPVLEPYKFEKDPSGINYVNSLKNMESSIYSSVPQSKIINPGYGSVFSKSGYIIVPDASPNSINVKSNDYVDPIYDRNTPSPKGFSNFNRVTQKPLKIAYSPANEVAHVTYSGGNGQVYYSW